ncbi:outer membrane receptor for ferric coprogen and ferric-rhodotorulic acid [Acinetobacter calcoaceticus]|uniref:Outer membrane receptor for ferric coprogen and ferric-rhodotorulic acid n=1 Tax=Acinetobacter calcoaceticus TaxID=471 RepID=A0A4R1XYR9_ACICA|nr:outer membrane receptor for ferric coprogen and ferric-rhodotorulic acid [Acinetobacter calcoaceticus]
MTFNSTRLAQSISMLMLCGLGSIVHAEATELPTIIVQADAESEPSYGVKKSTASTKLDLELKHTPQSLTVFTEKQIQDQNLLSTHDVMAQTSGISTSQYGQVGAGYITYYARGFAIKNIQRDGIPSSAESFGGGDMLGLEDSALYERIEVIRGSTGLTNGSGNPSASINYVRKRPTDELKASANVQVGTWDNYRSQIDVSGPLNQDGSVRGRAIAAYAEGGSQQERFKSQNALIYGALDIDLSENTLLTTALTAQQVKLDDATVHGIPYVSNDTPAQAVHFGRKSNAAADWTYSDTEKFNLFLGLEHQFNQDWKGVANYAYTHAQNDRVYGVVASGGITYDTPYNGRIKLEPGEMALTSGRMQKSPDVHSLDLYLTGDFQAFGQQHSISLGTNGYQVKSDDPKYKRYMTTTQIAGWNGAVERPDFQQQGRSILDEKQYGAFAAVNLQLLDPLKLILGSRVSQWERRSTEGHQKENGIFTPYVGIIYDLNQQWSTYASYTSIFNPSSAQDIQGQYLDPEEGNSLEFGIKAAFYDGRLNASAAYFQTKQDNLAVQNGIELTPSGNQAYKSIDGAEVTGYDLSLAGEILAQWHIQAGYTYTKAEDQNGAVLNTNLPTQMLKVFTSYQHDQWTIGGGVNWQSQIYAAGTKGLAAELNKQDSYALVNLMGRYQISPELTIGLNINNVFDKVYKANPTSFWGAGRNMTASLNYRF